MAVLDVGAASSPRAWGWTDAIGEQLRILRSSPRAWGWTDVPGDIVRAAWQSSPRAWGWTGYGALLAGA